MKEILEEIFDNYRFIYTDTGISHVFKRTDEGCPHRVVIEDDRRGDIVDFLIFSYLEKDETDWFGNKIDSPYPLTLGEYELFAKFIEELKKGVRDARITHIRRSLGSS